MAAPFYIIKTTDGKSYGVTTGSNRLKRQFKRVSDYRVLLSNDCIIVKSVFH